MAYLRFEDPFILHVDASEQGPGAVLYNADRMASSELLTQNIDTSRNKLLITFRETRIFSAQVGCYSSLFYAPSVKVYSDNNPITYVLSTAELNATGHCRCLSWLTST